MVLRRLARFCFLACGIWSGPLEAAQVEAIFVVMGDQHSAYARTAQVVARVDRLRAENPDTPLAVLINGDSMELGNAIARRSAGAIDLAMFAALARRAPTILNLGNHEPDFSDVPETIRRMSETGVTVIGNLADRATGQLFAPASTRLRLRRADIVVAGVTTDSLAQYRAAVRPTLDLTAPAVWAREKFPALLSTAPVRILLSHAGLRLDRGMFPFVPEGTLFAGAHDHAQFVQRMGRTVYFHSGSWNSHVSIVRLRLEPDGPSWEIEQPSIRDSDPADPELASLIRQVREGHLTTEDAAVVGTSAEELSRTQAAGYVVQAVRKAAGADAAFVGNTTFGAGLPAGEVSRAALDDCVRFDGTIWIAEIPGARLRTLMRNANQGPDTPFDQRQGEFHYADGPAEITDERLYRIATNDWAVRNRDRYFGPEEINFVEKPELRLKALVAASLATGASSNDR